LLECDCAIEPPHIGSVKQVEKIRECLSFPEISGQ
jgi:hypothetical protein